jgi:hypothetical protein
VPRAGSGDAHGVLFTEFGVVFHDFAHQLFDHGLPAGIVEIAGQLRHGFGKGRDNLAGVDSVRHVGGHGVVGIEIVDQLDNLTMQTWAFAVFVLVFCNGRISNSTNNIGSQRSARHRAETLK